MDRVFIENSHSHAIILEVPLLALLARLDAASACRLDAALAASAAAVTC